jgi:hypothetical protein
MPDPTDQLRIQLVAKRIAMHAARELRLLEQAVAADDDDMSRALEVAADVAHLDLLALTQEHGLDR